MSKKIWNTGLKMFLIKKAKHKMLSKRALEAPHLVNILIIRCKHCNNVFITDNSILADLKNREENGKVIDWSYIFEIHCPACNRPIVKLENEIAFKRRRETVRRYEYSLHYDILSEVANSLEKWDIRKVVDVESLISLKFAKVIVKGIEIDELWGERLVTLAIVPAIIERVNDLKREEIEKAINRGFDKLEIRRSLHRNGVEHIIAEIVRGLRRGFIKEKVIRAMIRKLAKIRAKQEKKKDELWRILGELQKRDRPILLNKVVLELIREFLILTKDRFRIIGIERLIDAVDELLIKASNGIVLLNIKSLFNAKVDIKVRSTKEYIEWMHFNEWVSSEKVKFVKVENTENVWLLVRFIDGIPVVTHVFT